MSNLNEAALGKEIGINMSNEITIKKEALNLFINGLLIGMGEGCKNCDEAIRVTIPAILTNHGLVLTQDEDLNFSTMETVEFFQGSTLKMMNSAFSEVFGYTPSINELTSLFNHINIDNFEFIVKPKDYRFSHDLLATEFSKNKLLITPV